MDSQFDADAAVERAGQATRTIELPYRAPYDWKGLLEFLSVRQLKGVEWVTDSFYARTVQIGSHRGWIRVTHPERTRALRLEYTRSLTPALPTLLKRTGELFDLDARPGLIASHLRQDRRLAVMLERCPGIRVPGAFNGFEMGLRAIIGQQITVKAATTVSCRVAAAFGDPIATPFPPLDRLSPSPARLARASVDDIAKLGIVSARTKCIIALAQAHASGQVNLDVGVHPNPQDAIKRLTELPGIGQWTAHYIAMRALRWPDAFPKEDIVVRNNLGGVSAREAEAMSRAWSPWRSYAVMHIWRNPPQDAAARP
jgi:AraC family transcriptional regulator of adaptative response / DNA-3-methyladenine glycosylase II